jgi:hypothetical protein
MFVTALYKVYTIWTFCFTGHKALMKAYQWFYWIYISQIPKRCLRRLVLTEPITGSGHHAEFSIKKKKLSC